MTSARDVAAGGKGVPSTIAPVSAGRVAPVAGSSAAVATAGHAAPDGTTTPAAVSGDGAAGNPDVQMGTAGAAGATVMQDCTQPAWDNPGKVASVSLSEIPAAAGKKMRPFESIDPLRDYVRCLHHE